MQADSGRQVTSLWVRPDSLVGRLVLSQGAPERPVAVLSYGFGTGTDPDLRVYFSRKRLQKKERSGKLKPSLARVEKLTDSFDFFFFFFFPTRRTCCRFFPEFWIFLLFTSDKLSVSCTTCRGGGYGRFLPLRSRGEERGDRRLGGVFMASGQSCDATVAGVARARSRFLVAGGAEHGAEGFRAAGSMRLWVKCRLGGQGRQHPGRAVSLPLGHVST